MKINKVEKSRIKEVDFDNLVFGQTLSDHMFVMDYTNGQWGEPSIEPFGGMSFFPSIASLHYGQTIFEGLKAYKNENGSVLLFKPDTHEIRINNSASRLCMPELPAGTMSSALKALLDIDRDWVPTQPGQSLYIRPLMFATEQTLGVHPSHSYRFVIFTSPVASYYSGAVKVKVEREYVRAAEGGTGFIKSGGNYAASLLPTQNAINEGYNQVLWTDSKEHKYIEEIGTMNVFFQIGDNIVTPELTSSILPGITRQSVIDLAKKWGLVVEERKVTVTEVLEAQQNGQLKDAFGSGTAATITQISTIGDKGVDYELDPSLPREFSTRAQSYLNKLKVGQEEDYMSWMVTI